MKVSGIIDLAANDDGHIRLIFWDQPHAVKTFTFVVQDILAPVNFLEHFTTTAICALNVGNQMLRTSLFILRNALAEVNQNLVLYIYHTDNADHIDCGDRVDLAYELMEESLMAQVNCNRPLNSQDRLVKVRGYPDNWFRLQKSGGHNSRLQKVDLNTRTVCLSDSFKIENSKLYEQTTFGEMQLGELLADTIRMEVIEVDAEVYAKISAYKTQFQCDSHNTALRRLFKL